MEEITKLFKKKNVWRSQNEIREELGVSNVWKCLSRMEKYGEIMKKRVKNDWYWEYLYKLK